MTNDMLGEVQDIIIQGIENNSAPVLNIEVALYVICRMHRNLSKRI